MATPGGITWANRSEAGTNGLIAAIGLSMRKRLLAGRRTTPDATQSTVKMAQDEVTQHYESLLAANYTWMFGVPFDAKVAEQRDLLRRVLGDDAFFF